MKTFQNKFVSQQIIKNFKKTFLTTSLQLYFLTNEITNVDDSGACFIE